MNYRFFKNNNYDIIIIGGGSAGFSVLEQISHHGLKIALVENRKLGGSCPNFACVPSKALIKCAEVLHTVANAANFGIIAKAIEFDWKKVQEYRANKVANTAAQQSVQDLKEKQVDLIWGTAKFISDKEIEVSGKTYEADKFVITTGSNAKFPEIPGIETVDVLDFVQILQIEDLPKSLVVLGAGPVGIEIGQMLARFGTQVTILANKDRILDKEEPEIAHLAQHYLEHDGINFIFNAEVTGLAEKVGIKEVKFNVDGKKQSLQVQQVLTAIGVAPEIDKLNLESTGIEYLADGIKVNEYMQTSKPNIYAAGDVVGIMDYTHAASYEGYIIGQNLLGKNIKADHRVISRGTFCDPEIGSVGITEQQAKEKGVEILTAVMPYDGGRGDIVSDLEGLIKVTVNKKDKTILGASILGSYAAESVHLIALAMHANLPVYQLDTMVYAFPTYMEGFAGITGYLQ